MLALYDQLGLHRFPSDHPKNHHTGPSSRLPIPMFVASGAFAGSSRERMKRLEDGRARRLRDMVGIRQVRRFVDGEERVHLTSPSSIERHEVVHNGTSPVPIGPHGCKSPGDTWPGKSVMCTFMVCNWTFVVPSFYLFKHFRFGSS